MAELIRVFLDTSAVRKFGAQLEAVAPGAASITNAAVRKVAADIEADAKGLAPVDTGSLRSSISTSTRGGAGSGTITAEIGPTVDYGIYQELGTSKMPAHPYLTPAFDRRSPQLQRALLQIVRATGL